MNGGVTIAPAPDVRDERLAELVKWTSGAGMPDVHAMLLDLQRHRAAMKRLEAWAAGLDGNGPEDGGSHANIRFAAELLSRIKGDSK